MVEPLEAVEVLSSWSLVEPVDVVVLDVALVEVVLVSTD